MGWNIKLLKRYIYIRSPQWNTNCVNNCLDTKRICFDKYFPIHCASFHQLNNVDSSFSSVGIHVNALPRLSGCNKWWTKAEARVYCSKNKNKNRARTMTVALLKTREITRKKEVRALFCNSTQRSQKLENKVGGRRGQEKFVRKSLKRIFRICPLFWSKTVCANVNKSLSSIRVSTSLNKQIM